MSRISFIQMGPNSAEGAATHPDRIIYIFLKPHPVKQPSKGVKIPLQTLWIGQRYHFLALDYVCCECNGSMPMDPEEMGMTHILSPGRTPVEIGVEYS